MPPPVVNICNPNRRNVLHVHPVDNLVNIGWVFGFEPHSTRPLRSARPDFIRLDKRKHFFIGHTVLVRNDEEAFIRLYEPSKKPPELRESRIRDNDIRLV